MRPTIALLVTGSIAAYKAAIVARLLHKAGARVIPVMTRGAKEFVGPATLSGICGEAVRSDMFAEGAAGEIHVDLAHRVDAIVVVPATADVLARFASGRADDLVSALVLCARGPVLVAPAMHPRMWAHPATQRNVARLIADGVEMIGPVSGEVASGETGIGRMAEPEAIAEAVLARACALHDFAGLRVVVTAGPTLEDLDPVRFLGNRSTGKMGFAIAARGAARGAAVTLIAGPVQLPTPFGVHRVDVRSAADMRAALWEVLQSDLSGTDALVMSAAVSDYRPRSASETKLKRSASEATLDLAPNPDLLAEIGAARSGPKPVLVGFAVETAGDAAVVAAAEAKRRQKRVDLVVANHASDSFGRDDNRATLVHEGGSEPLGVLPKTELADRILDRIGGLCRA